MELVAARKNLFILLAERVLHHEIVLVRTEQKPQGRVVARGQLGFVVVVDVELHLPKIGVRELLYFEVEKDVAFQNDVVENQVDIEVIAFQRDSLLPRHKSEPSAQFQQETLKVRD